MTILIRLVRISAASLLFALVLAPSQSALSDTVAVDVPEIPLPPNSPSLANVVRPNGGQIGSPDGRATLVVPGGAVEQPTLVLSSVTTPSDRDSEEVFEVDVTLLRLADSTVISELKTSARLELRPNDDDIARLGSEEGLLTLNRLDPDGGVIVPQPSVDYSLAPNLITAEITSSGRYALVHERPTVNEVATAIVEPVTGGVLSSKDSRVRLDFPPGATTERLEIQHAPAQASGFGDLRLIDQFELTAKAIDRGNADVSTFNTPISVTISYSSEELVGLNSDALTLNWLDEAKSVWVPVEGQVNHGDGSITAFLTHFSIYSIGTTPYIAGPGHNLWHQVDQHAGAATYTIPMPLLPGPGGFKPPDPNLTYSSSRVDEMKSAMAMGSHVGIGWNFDIPIIRRDPPTNRYYLEMNGSSDELIQTGTDTDGSTKWSTRNESGQRVRSKTVNGIHAVFVVTQKDGTQYRFGTREGLDQPNTLLQRWYWRWDVSQGWLQEYYAFDLGRVIDTHQNYADYYYWQPGPFVVRMGSCSCALRHRHSATSVRLAR